MGQIANMDRAARFIKEFNVDAGRYLGFGAGTVLKVKDVYLADGDGTDYGVRVRVDLADERGRVTAEITGLAASDVLFEPNDDARDTVERLAAVLGKTEDEIRRRLIRAGLFRPEDFRA